MKCRASWGTRLPCCTLPCGAMPCTMHAMPCDAMPCGNAAPTHLSQVMWGSEDDLFDRGYEWPMRAIVGLQYTLPDEDLDFPDDAITRDLLKRHIMVCSRAHLQNGCSMSWAKGSKVIVLAWG